VVITDVSPMFVMLDKASFKVTITGDNFYASDIMQIRLTEVDLGNGGTLI